MAATKSYTAQLAALYWVGLYLAEQKNSLPAEQLAALKQDLCELPAKMEEILSNAAAVKSIADKLKNFNANGYAAGELKHGPIALLDENMPVMAVLGPGITLPKMISNCEEAKARNALLAAVVSEKADIAPGLFDYRLNIPDTNETTFPLLANIPLQLLAYYIADSLGREVDQPRNLAKSVTVE